MRFNKVMVMVIDFSTSHNPAQMRYAAANPFKIAVYEKTNKFNI